MHQTLTELAAEAGLHTEWFIDNPEIEKFVELILHRVYAQIHLTMSANMESEQIAWCCEHLIEKLSSDFGILDNEQTWGDK